MISKRVSVAEHAIYNSAPIAVFPNQKYQFSTTVAGKRGLPYAAYVTAIAIDSTGEELARHIRWLNDFGGTPTEYSVVFSTPARAASVVLGYRINAETPTQSDSELYFYSDFSKDALRVAEENADLRSDRFSDYAKATILDGIAQKLRREDYQDFHTDLGVINALSERIGLKQKWEKGKDPEIRHWTEYLLAKIRDNESEKYRIDPQWPLSKEVTDFLPASGNQPIQILDVGAGPLTTLGKVWSDRKVSIFAVDALADIYGQVLDQAKIVPPIRTTFAEAERLSEQFPANHFDFIYCSNALDHCYNPLKAIQSMIEVLKPGSYILLTHFPNEAENEAYGGFHQWNLWAYQEHFIIWNREDLCHVNKIFERVARIKMMQNDEQRVVCHVRKNPN